MPKRAVLASLETINDSLAFEPTPERAELELELPSPGSDQSFYFVIHGVFVERMPAPEPPPIVQAPPPGQELPQAAPYNPEHDLELRRKIVSDFQRRLRQIQQTSQGMSFDRANEYRRRERVKLIAALAKDYNLSVGQVSRIVGR
jgi:hypothetical protein